MYFINIYDLIYMTEKYYREINTNKDIVKFKLQL